MRSKFRSGLTVLLMTAGASFLYMVNSGIRANFGILLSSLVESTGLALSSVSFVLAVGQFSFGVTQPLFGVVANRRGNRFALIAGSLFTLAGVLLLPLCRSRLSLMAVLGILLPGGLGAVSFGVILGAVSPRIPPRQRTTVSGIVNASCGIGNTLLTPILSAAIGAGGLALGMNVLSVFCVLSLPIVLMICGKEPRRRIRENNASGTDAVSLTGALRSRDYLFIVIGFFTCGFHMALITNHLATQIVSYGFSFDQSARAFSLYGVATILGALSSGMLCAKYRMKDVLGALYGLRVIAVLLFLVLPKTMPVICAFVILLGATGSSTVTPRLRYMRKAVWRSGLVDLLRIRVSGSSDRRFLFRVAGRPLL